MQRRIFTRDRRAARRKQLVRDLVVGALFVALVQVIAPLVPAIKKIAEQPTSVLLALVTPENPYGDQ